MRKVLLAVVCAFVLVGCGMSHSDPQQARIVQTYTNPDCPSDTMTVVEFPDRSRWEKCGRWGAVGDTVLAVKVRDPMTGAPYYWQPAF